MVREIFVVFLRKNIFKKYSFFLRSKELYFTPKIIPRGWDPEKGLEHNLQGEKGVQWESIIYITNKEEWNVR